MKRAYVLLGLLGAIMVSPVLAQAPAPTAAPRTDKPRIAVFNVAKVMKDFEKWQYYAATMSNKRVTVAGQLGKLRGEIQDLDKRLQTEVRKEQQEAIQKMMIAKQREFDDQERNYRKQLDEESSVHLKELFNDIDRAVKAIVAANEYDIVFAYPDAVSPEEANSPLYYDIKMRPPAAMPFYVSKTVDITPMLVETLNKAFKAPGPIPAPLGGAQPVGGTAPATPPPAGLPGGR